MTPRTWAERYVMKRWQVLNHLTDDEFVVQMVKESHARAVRIVKRHIKAMEGATPYQWEKGYQQALTNVLAALQQGRGKGGKG